MIRWVMCAGVVCGLGLRVWAGDTAGLSLAQALSAALSHNPLVRVERIDVEIAKSYVRENIRLFDPSIDASVSVVRVPDAGEQQVSFSSSITQTIPGGGSLQGSMGVQPVAGGGVDGAQSYRSGRALTFSQAVLQGAGLGVSLAPLRRSRLDITVRTEELAGYGQKLLADTERAYWELYLAGREAGIRRHAAELAQRLLFESEERLKAGSIAQIDLISVKAEAALRDKDLIGANAALAQKQYRLIYLLGDWQADTGNSAIAVSDSPSGQIGFDPVPDHIAVALKRRPDLILARALAAKGDIAVVQTRNCLLPRLDFFIGLQGTEYAASFGDALSANRPEFAVEAGLHLVLPVTGGASRARHHRARLEREQIDVSIRNLERLIKMEILTAYSEVTKAHQQIEAAGTAVRYQQERVAAEQEKLAAGKTTSYFVLAAQRDLIAAELDEARSRVSYETALADIYLKDGTLLQRRGIQWE